MSNIFGILQNSISGLMVAQVGLDVTGHNLANLNTEGYSRQRAVSETQDPLVTPYGSLGTGVRVATIQRTYDDVLAKTVRNETSSLNYWEGVQTSLSKVEIYFNELETGSGLGDSLSDYFNAWQDLANTAPDNSDESLVKRYTLVETTVTLTQKIQEGYNYLEDIRDQSDINISKIVDQVNDITANIAFLNRNIARAETSGNPANDLRDKRELLVNELAELININTQEKADGQLAVFVGGMSLVESAEANKLYAVENSENDGHFDIYWGASSVSQSQYNITDKINGGTIYAEINTRDGVIKDYQDDLDELASNIITETNKIHSTGQGLSRLVQATSLNGVANPSYLLSEAPGKFPYSINSGTIRITVYGNDGEELDTYDIDIDPSKDSLNAIIQRISSADNDSAGGNIQAYISEDNSIRISTQDGYSFAFTEDTSNFLVAAGLNSFFKGSGASNIEINSLIKDQPSYIAASKSGAEGDNENAFAVAEIKYNKLSYSGITIEEFYGYFAAEIGSDKSQVDVYVSSKSMAVDELTLKLEEVKGVSQEEELMNMIKYQKAYEANARFMTAIDEILEKLINGVGRVGL